MAAGPGLGRWRPAQPLYLRIGSAPALADGWVRGQIGPFGSQSRSRPRETSPGSTSPIRRRCG
jgi:hypothetical protein